MAKNFTQFQEISGSKSTDEVTGNVTVTTEAERDMYAVGYDDNEPGGERRYTLESIIHLTDKSDVGLEHVTNESKETMFTDPTFTSAEDGTGVNITGDLTVTGDFTVAGTGSEVTMETTVTQTSAFEVENEGTSTALKVVQSGTEPIAEFLDDEDIAMIIDHNGNIGMGVSPQLGNTLTVVGAVDVGSLSATEGANIQGRDLQADGNKLDTIQANADVTVSVLDNVANALVVNGEPGVKGFDFLEDGDIYKKIEKDAIDKPGDWWATNGVAINEQYSYLVSEPSVSGDIAHGLWDASREKLYSVETGADVTGAHSKDITYNDIPDGPWMGSTGTTHVKMLSAEREKLTELTIGSSVDPALTSGNIDDEEGLLTQQNIVDAYHAGYVDFWSSNNEQEYRNTIVPTVTAATINSINPETAEPYKQDELKAVFGKSEAAGLAVFDDVEVTDSLEVKDLTVQETGSLSIGTSGGMTTVVNIEGTELHFVNGLLVDYVDGDDG